MKLMEMMEQGSDFVTMLVKKLSPPLVTLLSAEPEIQYVALRNINLIVQKRYVKCLGKFVVSMLPELAYGCKCACPCGAFSACVRNASEEHRVPVSLNAAGRRS